MGRKQKLREEKRKIKNNPRPLLSVAAAITATAIKTVAPAIIVPPPDDHQIPKSRTNEGTDCNAFPKSHFHKVGVGLLEGELFDFALDAFKRGAAETGCVPCMLAYAEVHSNKILRLPWLLEGAIRGHTTCMFMLFYDLYCEGSILAFALRDYWERIYISVPQDNLSCATKEMRKNRKKEIGTSCFICSKIDTNTLTLRQCKGCSFYCYCSEICQTTHWDEMNHRGECQQLNILNDYHKPYAKIIRKAIIRGDDPKHIPELQTLRTKLGLNRPEEDYKELVELLKSDNYDDDDDDDDDLWNHKIADKLRGRPNPYRYVTTEKGTVHIGSTPELI